MNALTFWASVLISFEIVAEDKNRLDDKLLSYVLVC